ncbi:MAG: HIT family protein [Flavobacteriales bacterium]|nr:HIT family protein [Flavobacteriales bacterium]
MRSIFTSIIEGQIPSYKISEEASAIAFLDIFPLKEGHTLVVPKREIDHWSDLPSEEFAQLMQFAHTIGNAIKKAIPCERVGMAIAGFEIAHCHIHLIPVNNMHEMEFSNPKLQFTDEQFKAIAERIQQKLI